MSLIKHTHTWDLSYKPNRKGISCTTCNYVIEATPLSSHELVKAIYNSTHNIYHTLCYNSDSGGVEKIKNFNLQERLTALDILTMNRYPQEILRVKDELKELHHALLTITNFRINQISIMTLDGCYTDVELGINLEYYDARITNALAKFSETILKEEGYTAEDAQAYLALQDPPIDFNSYKDFIS